MNKIKELRYKKTRQQLRYVQLELEETQMVYEDCVDKFNIESEMPLIGIVKHTDGSYRKGDLIGFTPFSTYEFIIDGKRLYRVMTQFITIKYEYEGNEEEYNPSWAESGRRAD